MGIYTEPGQINIKTNTSQVDKPDQEEEKRRENQAVIKTFLFIHDSKIRNIRVKSQR
jgi:hypothetical protein